MDSADLIDHGIQNKYQETGPELMLKRDERIQKKESAKKVTSVESQRMDKVRYTQMYLITSMVGLWFFKTFIWEYVVWILQWLFEGFFNYYGSQSESFSQGTEEF